MISKFLIFVIIISVFNYSLCIISISEKNEFKKILKSHSNILVTFLKNEKSELNLQKILNDVDSNANKIARIVKVDCELSKKLCKYLKIKPDPVIIQHYHKGKFNKIYDRKNRVVSFIRFLEDPVGDIPWEEDDTAKHIKHIKSSADLQKIAKVYEKQLPSIVMMFYAPWCGFCTKMKPHFASAASDFKSENILFLGINGDIPTTEELKQTFNITGYPSIFLIQEGNKVYKFENENSKEALVTFIKNPGKAASAQSPSAAKEQEEPWSEQTNAVEFLTDDNFQEFVSQQKHVLVVFYAPWCGFCKKIKPEMIAAAEQIRLENIDAQIAAVDSTVHKNVSTIYEISGFPSVKYFKDGTYQFDVQERTKEGLVKFLKNPEKPVPPPTTLQWKDESPDNSLVLHPSPEEFRPLLKQKKHALVMFYAPWCGHCKTTKPEFNEASIILKDEHKLGLLGIDCTAGPDYESLCRSYNVSGYPSIIYFNYAKQPDNIRYVLERNADDFVAFLRNPQQPKRSAERHWRKLPGYQAIVQLTSENFVQELVSRGQGGTLVMFYAPWCGHCNEMKPDYIKAAQTLQTSQPSVFLGAVDATSEMSLAKQYKVSGYPTLIYFEPSGEWSQYSSGRSEQNIVDFMTQKIRERQEAEERIKQQEEQKRLKEEAERKHQEQQRLEEERRLKEEAERKLQEQQRLEEERRLKEEAERKLQKQQRLEEERILKEEAERKLQEQQRLEEERRLKEEAERKLQEQQRLDKEEEEKRLKDEGENQLDEDLEEKERKAKRAKRRANRDRGDL